MPKCPSQQASSYRCAAWAASARARGVCVCVCVCVWLCPEKFENISSRDYVQRNAKISRPETMSRKIWHIVSESLNIFGNITNPLTNPLTDWLTNPQTRLYTSQPPAGSKKFYTLLSHTLGQRNNKDKVRAIFLFYFIHLLTRVLSSFSKCRWGRIHFF